MIKEEYILSRTLTLHPTSGEGNGRAAGDVARKAISVLAGVLAITGLGAVCAASDWSVLVVFAYLFAMAITLIRYEIGTYFLIFCTFIGERAIGFKVNWDPQTFFQIYDYIPFYFPIFLSTFAGFVMSASSRVTKWPQYNPIAIPLFVILSFAAVTLISTPNLLHSLHQYSIFLMNVGIYILILSVLTTERRHRGIVWLIVIWGVIHALIVYSLYFFDENVFVTSYEFAKGYFFETNVTSGFRMFGTSAIRRGSAFQGHNPTAAVMYMTFPLCLGLYMLEKGRRTRAFLVTAMFLTMGVLVMTMSRAGLGSFIITCIFMFYILRRLRPRFLTLSVITVVLVFGAVLVESQMLEVFFKRETTTPRLFKMASESDRAGITSAAERVTRWKEAFKRLSETFPLGDGVGNFKANTRIKTFYHAHSITFSYLFDFGLIGGLVIFSIALVMFTVFLSVVKYQSSYLDVMSIMAFGSLLAVSIQGLVDFDYNIQFIWTFLALAFGTVHMARRARAEEGAQSLAAGSEPMG